MYNSENHCLFTLRKNEATLYLTRRLIDLSEHSQLANARFQAAGALRDAAIREWSSLEADVRRGLVR